MNIWRCTHCGSLVEGLQQIEKHDMECKGAEPGECRICHQAVGVEDGLEDDGDSVCHPCRIAELEAALARAEEERDRLQALSERREDRRLENVHRAMAAEAEVAMLRRIFNAVVKWDADYQRREGNERLFKLHFPDVDRELSLAINAALAPAPEPKEARCRIAELEAALIAAEAEVKRYKEREAYFAHELGVADGGQYRADWPGAMQRVLKERDVMRKGRLEMEIQRLHPDAPLPAHATEGSAGLDLYAFDPEARQQQWTIPPSTTRLIPCGIAVVIPQGYVGLVCPRSGLAIKYSVTVGNAPGVIDSDYRGPVCVILTNHEPRRGCAYIVNESDRIAQLVVVPHLAVKWREVARLGNTARGEGGFGSTGG